MVMQFNKPANPKFTKYEIELGSLIFSDDDTPIDVLVAYVQMMADRYGIDEMVMSGMLEKAILEAV